MKNDKLQELIENCDGKSNKELANSLLILKADFDNIKNVVLDLTETMHELEVTYDTLYNKLQERLKFKDLDES